MELITNSVQRVYFLLKPGIGFCKIFFFDQNPAPFLITAI